MLEQKLNEWVRRVVAAHDGAHYCGVINTFQMVVDVDKIIAEEFNHAPVIKVVG